MSRNILLLLYMILTVAGSGSAHAAPEADLWGRWTRLDPASRLTVDHSAWDGFLKAYVGADHEGIHRVAYARVTEIDRAALAGYLDRLGETPVSRLNRAEQLAFWINLYNALTLHVVLGHYPVGSIRDIDISPGILSNGPWGKKLIDVEGESVSLDDIEHRILRPIWKDPRIHYAVNCAAVGCPNLQVEAFTAANTDTLLTDAARAYVNHPRGARFEGGGLIVSSIYDWFKSDFGGTDETVIAHLKRYAEGKLHTDLEQATHIEQHAYDWSINAMD